MRCFRGTRASLIMVGWLTAAPAVAFLKRRIEQEPVGVPRVPAHPDESGRK